MELGVKIAFNKEIFFCYIKKYFYFGRLKLYHTFALNN
jgi:hypothetical protein